MKNSIVTALFAILSFLLISLISAEKAMAQTVVIPQMELLHMADFKEKFVTVYYAIGNRATLSTSGDQVSLREVKRKVTLKVDADVVTVPTTELVRSGIFMAYNIVVFVVHKEPLYQWKNANGDIPQGEEAEGTQQSVLVDSVTKVELEQALETAANGVLKLDIGGHLRAQQQKTIPESL